MSPNRRADDRRQSVKYMLLNYDNPDTRDLFSNPEGSELVAEMDGLMAELTASGELVGSEGGEGAR
jgi:hypothetical protein